MILVRQLFIQLDDAVEAVARKIPGGRVVVVLVIPRQRRSRPKAFQRAVAVQQVEGNLVVRHAPCVQD